MPPQTLTAEQTRRLNAALNALNTPELCDFRFGILDQSLGRVIINKNDEPWFALQREGLDDAVDGVSRWHVRWKDGRELADSTMALRLLNAVNRITADSMTTQLFDHNKNQNPAPSFAPTTTIEYIFLAQNEEPSTTSRRIITQTINDTVKGTVKGTVTSPDGTHYSGTITYLPELLSTLSPDACLNTTPLNMDARRISRLQRIQYTDNHQIKTAEEFQKRGPQNWYKKYPQEEPASDDAIRRLTHYLCAIIAERVRFTTPQDLAALAQPEREIDIHVQSADLQARQDNVLISDTLAHDWGLSLYRDQNVWWGVSKTGSLAYQLSDADVETLFASLGEAPLLPVPISLITGLEWKGSGHFALERNNGSWQIIQNNQRIKADANQVRRFLGTLRSAYFSEKTRLNEQSSSTDQEQSFIIHVTTPLGVESITYNRAGPGRLVRNSASEYLNILPEVLIVSDETTAALFVSAQWFQDARELLTPIESTLP